MRNQNRNTAGRGIFALILLVLLCELVGITGALLTGTGNTPWYRELVKPSFNPPGWVFGPVWTILYAMMAVAAWMVWRVDRSLKRPDVRVAIGIFFVQLLFNFLWTPVFFGLHSIGGAMAIIVLLWFELVMTTVLFWRVSRPAGALLLPYLAWVTFASVLNGSILALN